MAPRALQFKSEDEAIAEVDRLRRGYRRHGKWSLGQIAWHLALPMSKHLEPAPPGAQPTPEQTAIKAGFVDVIVQTGKPPAHAKTAPPSFMPPETAGDADIDNFKSQMLRMKQIDYPMVAMGPIGPVPTAEVRLCHLAHASHHLSFLTPEPARRREGLRFETIEDVIEDINTLRRGYGIAGTWTLPIMCAHLAATVDLRMQPGPFAPNTPEQDARREMMLATLSSGKLPSGLPAPPQLVPQTAAPESAIDQAIDALKRLRDFRGDLAPHRLFGQMNNSDAHKLSLIHCAHHLSHLAPST